MRAAFYAPLKPPHHPTPSGDRRIVRLFQAAFERIGVDTPLASDFRSREPTGDPSVQAKMAADGDARANAAIQVLAGSANFWFTYHLYYKAVDWFGPEAAARMGIPYVLAEASYAPKRAGGPWDLSHKRVAHCVREAAAILCLNPNDAACLAPLLDDESTLIDFPPFLDAVPYASAGEIRHEARTGIAAAIGADSNTLWLLAVGMMRGGDKAASYAALADALRLMPDTPDWRLLVVGDGVERASIETQLRLAAPDRVHFLGALDEAVLARTYAAADVMVWPAHGEAFGMAMLEAQASGLPVVAGRTGGVHSVVANGQSGWLTPLGDARAFAAAVQRLATNQAERQAFSENAAARVASTQSLDAAAARLETVLTRIGIL